MTFSRNELGNGAEKIDTNLVMFLEYVEEAEDGRKSSPNLHRKFIGALGFKTSPLD